MTEFINNQPHIHAQLSKSGAQLFYEVNDIGQKYQMSGKEAREQLGPELASQTELLIGSMSILGAGRSEETFGILPPEPEVPPNPSEKEELRELRNMAGTGVLTDEAQQTRLNELDLTARSHRTSRFIAKEKRKLAKQALAHYDRQLAVDEAVLARDGSFKNRDGTPNLRRQRQHDELVIRVNAKRQIVEENSRRNAKRRHLEEKKAFESPQEVVEAQTPQTPEEIEFKRLHDTLDEARKRFLELSVKAQLHLLRSPRDQEEARRAYDQAFVEFNYMAMVAKIGRGASERRLKALAAQMAVQEMHTTALWKGEILDNLQGNRVSRIRMRMTRQHKKTTQREAIVGAPTEKQTRDVRKRVSSSDHSYNSLLEVNQEHSQAEQAKNKRARWAKTIGQKH